MAVFFDSFSVSAATVLVAVVVTKKKK